MGGISITDPDVPDMRLFSYKMTTDSGFAPNPFGRSLTLATCKAEIRRCKKEGDWIAGFSSAKLAGHEVGSERLIYLMRVAEKLPMREYSSDPRFQDKIPDMSAADPIARAGDNIYRPRANAASWADFEQLPNPNHECSHHGDDVSGRYVLIADEFYYFGGGALVLPPEVRPKVPRGQHPQGHKTPPERARRFVEYIRNEFRPGRHGDPHRWPSEYGDRGGGCG